MGLLGEGLVDLAFWGHIFGAVVSCSFGVYHATKRGRKIKQGQFLQCRVASMCHSAVVLTCSRDAASKYVLDARQKSNELKPRRVR